MIHNSHFSDIKGGSAVIFIENSESNLHVSHCNFERCYKTSYYSYKSVKLCGTCILHRGNNASCSFISCCNCKSDYMSIILTINQDKSFNSHIFNELSFSGCDSYHYFIVADISPAYFTNANSSQAKISDLTIFHSAWVSVGGSSKFWTLTNNTCYSLLGHSNVHINYDHLLIISNKNNYLIYFYNTNENYVISNSSIVGNKMMFYRQGTLTLDSCIYDTKQNLVIKPNCISTSEFKTILIIPCKIYYKNVCSNMKFYAVSKYSLSFSSFILILL